MYKDRLALLVLTAIFTGCDGQNTAPTATVVEKHMPSWVKKLDRSALSFTAFEGPGRSIDDLAEEISRDDNHIDVLRRVFEACNQNEAGIAMEALAVITKKDPKPEYLELSDILLSRQGSLELSCTTPLFTNYPIETVIDRLVRVVTGENASRVDKISVLRGLDILLDRDGCELVSSQLDGFTRSILDESDDSHLIIETLILRRTCDLISNEDCLERLDAILAREGSDFRSRATSRIRALCANE